MPIDYSKYPADWKDIRARILVRAKGCCEFCGLANGAWIVRSSEDGSRYLVNKPDGIYYLNDSPVRMSEIPDEFAVNPLIRIVLTVAHLDHDTTHNDEDNLRALCQRCHLTYDAKHHAKNAAVTRREKFKALTGQQEMTL